MSSSPSAQTTRFANAEIGRKDTDGREIRCGSRVRVTVRRDGYRQTQGQDGWGRAFRLDRADQHDVPARIEEREGVIVYYEERSEFRVKFDQSYPESENVYTFKEIKVLDDAE